MLLLESWNDYRTRVISGDAPETQLRESRRAFYAGAASYAFMTREASGTLSEDDAVEVLKGIEAEFTRFHADILGGVA
jgi:hypothetical protein